MAHLMEVETIMMDRRHFLKSLAGLTAGILWSPHAFGAKATDRFGALLPTRILGRTNEAVTMLGVGGWHIGRMEEREAEKTIEVALQGGVRFFDSAESYQSGGSESRLGRLLVPKYRDVVYLMTKTAAQDAEGARKHLEDALRRLNTDHLDLWQVHNLTSAEDVDKRNEAGIMDVMVEAKESGKTRHIGFTGHTRPSALLRVLEETDVFDTCQLPINVADPSYESFIEGTLPKLMERKVGVLAMKTLANGGFFGGDRHGEHGDNPKLVPKYVTIPEAIHFVWSLPVSVLITGPDNSKQMQEKIDLAKSFTMMGEEARQALVVKASELAGKGVEFYKA